MAFATQAAGPQAACASIGTHLSGKSKLNATVLIWIWIWIWISVCCTDIKSLFCQLLGNSAVKWQLQTQSQNVSFVPKYTHSLRVTYLSLALNVLLSIAKCAIGFWVNSKAIIADGLHSFSDLSTDMAAVLGLKMASKPKDENHPYGHHKFASLSSLFIAVVLLGFCSGLIYASFRALFEELPVDPEWPAVLVALASILVKEWLFWRTRSIAIRERSRLLMANAWHHRTDSVSSLLVLFALLAVLLGGQDWAFLDKAVGVVLGCYLAFEGLKILVQSCSDLLDTAPENDIVNDLREHILTVEGVVAYHEFRARRVGDMFEVDFHLQVDPALTVEAGHRIARAVKVKMFEKHPELIGVLVHIEPANEQHIRDEGVSGGGWMDADK